MEQISPVILGLLYALPFGLFGGVVIYRLGIIRRAKTPQEVYILCFVGMGLTLLALWISMNLIPVIPPLKSRYASSVTALGILYGCCTGTLLLLCEVLEMDRNTVARQLLNLFFLFIFGCVVVAVRNVR